MQIRLPQPSTKFERDLIFSLEAYLRDIYNKIERQQGSKWDGNHPVMGEYHLWIDATNKLRMKKWQPTSDTDGVVIGTQT